MVTKKKTEPKKDLAVVGGFGMSLGEYLKRSPKATIEKAKGFKSALTGTVLGRGKKTLEEWDTLFQLFGSKPVGVSLEAWAAKNGGK